MAVRVKRNLWLPAVLSLLSLSGFAEAAELLVSPCDSAALTRAFATANSNNQPDVIRFDVSDVSHLSCCDSKTHNCSTSLSSALVLYEDETVLTGPDAKTGYTVTIDGSSCSDPAGIKIQGRHEKIQNLTFKNFPKFAVLIDGRWNSETEAVIENNHFEANGAPQQSADCPRVSNNPYMDSTHQTYYGRLLRDFNYSTQQNPAQGYPTSSGGSSVGITLFGGPPEASFQTDITGDSGCAKGIDYKHNFHVALASIGSDFHATVLLDDRLAHSKEEAAAFLQTKAASSRLVVDSFFKDVFVPKKGETAFDYQFPNGPIFACTCYNHQVSIGPSGGTVMPFGAVKIQYASKNIFRGNNFVGNGLGVEITGGGSAPADMNTLTNNLFLQNRKPIDLQWGNQQIHSPIITKAVMSGALGTVEGVEAGSTVEFYDGENGKQVGMALTTADHTFNGSADLAHSLTVWGTVTDLNGNTSEFSDPVLIDAIKDVSKPVVQPPPASPPLAKESDKKDSKKDSKDFFDSNQAEFNNTLMAKGKSAASQGPDQQHKQDQGKKSDLEAAAAAALDSAGGCALKQ